MNTRPRCYWCNREIDPDDLQMGLVISRPNGPVNDIRGGLIPEVPQPFHFVCLGAVGGAEAIDD